jgi:hypothetical protein
MKRSTAFWIGLACALTLAACSGEDGKDGRPVVKLSWSADINAADFSQVGIREPIIYPNTIYVMKPGPARIYWRSNVDWYFLDVVIDPGMPGGKGSATLLIIPEDGKDGQDRAYTVYISGNTLYVTNEQFVPVGAPFAADAAAPQLPTVLDRESAVQGAYEIITQ